MEAAFYVSVLMIVRLLVPVSVLLAVGTLLTKKRVDLR